MIWMLGQKKHCWYLIVVFVCLFLAACEGCKTEKMEKLVLPFSDSFERKELGSSYYSEMSGKWQIEQDKTSQNRLLCASFTRNNPLFLRKTLPRNVVVELDVWAKERIGDVKVELFTDGHYHATGYVFVQGGWKNRLSIIDRLDEHSPDCKKKEMQKEISCRRWKRAGIAQNKKVHWKITRYNKHIQWFVDGKLFLEYKDPTPLEGKGHGFFAFSNWESLSCFDNLKIDRFEPSVEVSKHHSSNEQHKQQQMISPPQKEILATPNPKSSPSQEKKITPSNPSIFQLKPHRLNLLPPSKVSFERHKLLVSPRNKNKKLFLQQPLNLKSK